MVTYEEGQQVADKLGIPFCETSAKTGTRVKEAFEKLVLEIPTHKSTQKVRSLIIFSPLMFIPKYNVFLIFYDLAEDI